MFFFCISHLGSNFLISSGLLKFASPDRNRHPMRLNSSRLKLLAMCNFINYFLTPFRCYKLLADPTIPAVFAVPPVTNVSMECHSPWTYRIMYIVSPTFIGIYTVFHYSLFRDVLHVQST